MSGSKEIGKLIAHSLKIHKEDQKRYWVAHMKDGTQLNEHNCRWTDVPLHQIVMMELSMMGNKYLIEKRNCPPTFVEFVQFKTAYRKLRGIPGKPDQTLSRCIGWHDSTTEYYIRVDEKTCKRIGDIHTYSPPRHLHPQSKLLIGSA